MQIITGRYTASSGVPEITTAAACLAGGSDAVIMRHPAAIKAIADMIEALV